MPRRKTFEWRLRTRSLELGPRTLVMGVVNVTPDSFSDGGMFGSPSEAVEHALRLFAEGADIVDLGGESTRPGAVTQGKELGLAGAVSAAEECARILPVIEGILREKPKATISIDTYKSEVARRAVEAGAELVNDVSGFVWDPEMASTVAELDCGAVMMHTRGRPQEWRTLAPEPNIVEVVKRGLAEQLAAAMRAGVDRDHLVLDPGFGFGKNMGENFPMLAQFTEFAELGVPLLAGTSRKSFLGRAAAIRRVALSGEPVHDLPPKERLYGSIGSAAMAVLMGAHIVRVHDVRETVDAIAVADAVINA